MLKRGGDMKVEEWARSGGRGGGDFWMNVDQRI